VKSCNCEAEDASSKDKKEHADRFDDLNNDCHKMADALDNAQLEQLIEVGLDQIHIDSCVNKVQQPY
jgi:hypothetical protein